ncbi:MAG: type II toxin-antitoxin system HicA family toxin [Nitrospirae bacterium]|nr:type II toxin-antitoxin system HicA family toxin [Nitrospirota bacterium]
MTKLPRVTGREVLAALRKAGFTVIRVKGSHHFLQHNDGRYTVVPVHAGETLGPGILNKILHDCDLSRDSFFELL